MDHEVLQALRRFALTGQRPAVQGAQTTTDASGGFAVPQAAASIIGNYADAGSAMRRICNPVQVDTGRGVPYGIWGSPPDAEFRDENEAASVQADLVMSGGVLKFNLLSSKIVGVSRELLQDSGTDIEAEILAPAATSWGLKANAAYTVTDAESPNIQALTDSAILVDFHASDTVATTDVFPALQRVARELPRNVRTGGQRFMATEVAADEIARAIPRRYPGAAPVAVDVNEDLTGAVTLNANGYAFSAIADKAILYGDIGRFYRIFDVGPFVIERFADGDYQARNVVGLRLSRRTTGRLIGPARSVIFAS